MSKKTAQERLPSVGKWSQLAQEHTAPSHGVKLDREHRLERDPDQVVPDEERVKAYQVRPGRPSRSGQGLLLERQTTQPRYNPG